MQVDVVLTSLVTAVHERLHHKVDVLVFNPPYVPTPSEEIGTHVTSIFACLGHIERCVVFEGERGK